MPRCSPSPLPLPPQLADKPLHCTLSLYSLAASSPHSSSAPFSFNPPAGRLSLCVTFSSIPGRMFTSETCLKCSCHRTNWTFIRRRRRRRRCPRTKVEKVFGNGKCNKMENGKCSDDAAETGICPRYYMGQNVVEDLDLDLVFHWQQQEQQQQ